MSQAGERVDVDTNSQATPADGLRYVTRAALTPLATLTTAHAEITCEERRSQAGRPESGRVHRTAVARREATGPVAITDLVAAGTLRPVIDSCYPLAGIADAHAA